MLLFRLKLKYIKKGVNKLPKEILPPTFKRVSVHTKPDINAGIRFRTMERLENYQDEPFMISQRLEELNYEWDTERFLEANAASIVILSTILGLTKSKYWFFLSGAVGMFLLQHALQGWCPPIPLIRRWGIRTAEEIHNEKIVLKMLRGDFKEEAGDISAMLTIAEK